MAFQFLITCFSLLAGCAALPSAASSSTSFSSTRDCHVSLFSSFLPADSHARVVSTTSVPAHGHYGQGKYDVAYSFNATNLPSLCAVLVNMTIVGNTANSTSTFTYGLFLPDEWNGRFLTVGNGGFGGGINWPDMGAGAQYNMAVMSTDLGHMGSATDNTFLDDPEKVINWSWRSLHTSVVLAKQMVAKAYGTGAKPFTSLFSSCSDGGRQGLLEAQMFPEDFDGIMVGSPPWWMTHQAPWLLKTKTYNLPIGAPNRIGEGLFLPLYDEVIKQCDLVSDGVKDGIVAEPWKCNFNAMDLLCKVGNLATGCLIPTQLNTLLNLYEDYFEIWDDILTNASFIYPSLEYGSEDHWNTIYGVSLGPPKLADILSVNPIVSEAVQRNAVSQVEQWAKPYNLDADNFDLSAFQKRGGKLVHFHGWADQIIPPRASIYYHQRVNETMSAKGVDINSFYRLFMVPGMQHCSGPSGVPWYFAGGNQACYVGQQATTTGTCTASVPGFEDTKHDMLMALTQWVEDDSKPVDQITATLFGNVVTYPVKMQRPVCAYPSTAAHIGGAWELASSWMCVPGEGLTVGTYADVKLPLAE